jgi:hypothetical protein
MKQVLRNAAGISKFFIGEVAIFLILFGFHWIAILAGVVLAIIYFSIPKRHLL